MPNNDVIEYIWPFFVFRHLPELGSAKFKRDTFYMRYDEYLPLAYITPSNRDRLAQLGRLAQLTQL